MKTDEKLIVDYVKGDMKAFETLYDRHKGGVYRYVLRQVKNQALCDDLFQDIWQKVIVNASSFTPKAKVSTWLYTLARNRIIDEVRHSRVKHLTIVDNHSDIDIDIDNNIDQEPSYDKGNVVNLESRLERDRAAAILKTCLSKLPNQFLDVFLLKQESGLTANQIADIVEAGLEATKSRLRTACSQLRACVEKKGVLFGSQK